MIPSNCINLKASDLTKSSEEFIDRITKQATGVDFTDELIQEFKIVRGLIWNLSKLIKGSYSFTQEQRGEKVFHTEALEAKLLTEQDKLESSQSDFSILLSYGSDENWESYVTLKKTTTYKKKSPKQAQDILRNFMRRVAQEVEIDKIFLQCWDLFFAYLSNLSDSYQVELAQVEKDPSSSLVLAIRPTKVSDGYFAYFEFERTKSISLDLDTEMNHAKESNT